MIIVFSEQCERSFARCLASLCCCCCCASFSDSIHLTFKLVLHFTVKLSIVNSKYCIYKIQMKRQTFYFVKCTLAETRPLHPNLEQYSPYKLFKVNSLVRRLALPFSFFFLSLSLSLFLSPFFGISYSRFNGLCRFTMKLKIHKSSSI